MSEAQISVYSKKTIKPVSFEDRQRLLARPWNIAFEKAGQRILSQCVISTDKGIFVSQKRIPELINQAISEYCFLRENIRREGLNNPDNTVRKLVYAVNHQDGIKKRAKEYFNENHPKQKYLFENETWIPGRLISKPQNSAYTGIINHGGDLETLTGNPVLKAQGIHVLPPGKNSNYIGAEIARVVPITSRDRIIRITQKALEDINSLIRPSNHTLWEACSFTQPDDCAALLLLVSEIKLGISKIVHDKEKTRVQTLQLAFECYCSAKDLTVASVKLA